MSTQLPSLAFDKNFEPRPGILEEVGPGIRRLLAPNPGPFTFQGTGTYIIGSGKVAVIDPGPNRDDHFESLISALAGETITHLLITHTHADHSPLAARVKERTGALTYAYGPHPEADRSPLVVDEADEADDEAPSEAADVTAEGGQPVAEEPAVEEPFDWDFSPDVVVGHGDVIEGTDWRVEAVHTPGHLANHVCFSLLSSAQAPDGRVLFSGDHVMAWSTSVISPPGGDMSAYLSSLDLLLRRSETMYWPTHGAPVRDPQTYVRGLIAHRRAREAQLLEQLAAGVTRLVDMVPNLYPGLDKRLIKAAARSLLGHAVQLSAEGRIICTTRPSVKAHFALA